MLRPNGDHEYHEMVEICPEDLNEWFTQIADEAPFRGWKYGAAVRCLPGSTDLLVAPYRVYFASGVDRRHADDGGARIHITTTETTVATSGLAADTTHHLYLSVTAGVASFSISTTAPDTARVYKTGDVAKRYLCTFETDGSGNPRPFASGPVPPAAAVGSLRGGTLRCTGTDNHIRVAPFVLTMVANTPEGFTTVIVRTETDLGVCAHIANTKYYVYCDNAGAFTVSTSAPDAAGVFKSGDESLRLFGTYTADTTGAIPAFNHAQTAPAFISQLQGGDLRCLNGTDVVIKPLEVAILVTTTGVVKRVEIATETTLTPGGLANDTWYYVYVYFTGEVPTFAATTTAPDAALRFASDDRARRYLGCFRTNGAGGINPFRKHGHRYDYLPGRVTIPTLLGGSVTVTTPNTTGWVAVNASQRVPPTSRVGLMRLELGLTSISGSGFAVANVRTAGTSADNSLNAESNIAQSTIVYDRGPVETDNSADRKVEYRLDASGMGGGSGAITLDISVFGFLEGGAE
jgi:hypothetical protein